MSIDPNEIFLDAYNLPAFDRQQFEGELERPIEKPIIVIMGGFFLLVGLIFLGRTYYLQITRGPTLAARSQTNTLRHTAVFPERGIIYDHRGEELAWNDPERTYRAVPGLAHVLGFVGYPTEEEIAAYAYEPLELAGRDGAEKVYNQRLTGVKGTRIEEVDAYGEIHSDYFLRPPQPGENLYLSI